jgi:membrane glycosyltransferase
MMLGVALVGFARLHARAREPVERRPRSDPLPHLAVLIPIYDESPARVFAGLEAMRASIAKTALADRCDIFVLSDSRDPDNWATEEILAARAAETDGPQIFYRHRTENAGRKVGNLRDFYARWSHRYPYVAVLDADSLISGETLAQLLQRMEARPELGILQVPARPALGRTLFARVLQFAGDVYGGPLIEGFRALYGPEAIFWGHNAVLRTEAFVAECGLPDLSGPPPLGGPILSHDFVEAALMRRAGYEVAVASDLAFSYEELPPNLGAYLRRDRRWCQGNLQHLRLLRADLPVLNRLWLLFGALGYLVAPLLIAFLVLATALGLGDAPGPWAGIAVGIAALGVLGPKLVGLAHILSVKSGTARRGGLLPAVVSVLLETLLTASWAPILLVRHTTFVLGVLAGRDGGWAPQTRSCARVRLTEAARAHVLETSVGMSGALLVTWGAPSALFGLSPMLLGLVVSIPLAKIAGSERLGQIAQRLRLFVSSAEVDPPRILRATEARLRPLEEEARRLSARDLVFHPRWLVHHLALLEASGQGRAAPPSLLERAKRRGWAALSTADRFDLLAAPDALTALHEHAWTFWFGKSGPEGALGGREPPAPDAPAEPRPQRGRGDAPVAATPASDGPRLRIEGAGVTRGRPQEKLGA